MIHTHNRWRAWVVVLAVLPLLSSAGAVAQAPPDSIAAWTQQLSFGTRAEKINAYSKLGQENAADLPPSTMAAVFAELRRIHDEELNGTAVPAPDDEGEGFGESYMDLVGLAAQVNTDEARQALVGAIGMSTGIQRRVARVGEPVLPTLRLMAERNLGIGGVYRTLGYAWFWADSTGAALSDPGRSEIITQLLDGLGAQGVNYRFVAAASLGTFEDPALLPLARLVKERERASGDETTARFLERQEIPALELAAQNASLATLLSRSQRILALRCLGSTNTFCVNALAGFQEAEDQLQNGNLTAVEAALTGVVGTADEALASGSLTVFEHALVAGGAQQVMDLGFSILRPTTTADTYLKQGTPNKNQGTDSIMRIRQSGKNRGLVRFDDAVFAEALVHGS